MATKPKISTLQASSVEILNAIRNSASANYRDYVPKAEPTAESIKAIGTIIMDYPALQNEFLSALVNRIGRVMITSKMYDNPLAFFKKGLLEFGETVEEIFVNIAKPFQYDPEKAETELFKRETPDVRAAFHILNYQKFYKATIQNEQLRQAFLSWQGVTDLIAKIVDAMYTAANYDEFQVMKYLLARHILNGELYAVEIDEVNTDNMKSIVSTVKGTSNLLEFMSSNYNLAGVSTFTKKDDQYIILNSKFDATMDVEVLASAFNMDRASFMGHRVLVDSFGSLDTNRLNELFANDKNYKPITPEEAQALDNIPAVIVDRDWFMIFDNMYNFTENFNGQGLYWNYFYHVWKTFSTSPFANAIVFVPGAPSVSAVTITPATVAEIAAPTESAMTIPFTASVTSENYASKAVTWELSGINEAAAEKPTIDIYGNLYIPKGYTGGSNKTLTVKATSVYNPSATKSVTVTFSA